MNKPQPPLKAEEKVSALEAEYSELLEKTLKEEEQNGGQDLAAAIQDIRGRLEMQYAARKEALEKEISVLRSGVGRKEKEMDTIQM